MKTQTTKKMMMAINVLLLIAISAMAQTYYYNTSRTFVEDGYTYRCNTTDWGYVSLNNIYNIYTESKLKYKDGSPVNDTKILHVEVSLIEKDNWTKQKCMSIVDNAFSDAEMQRVEGNKFMVVMVIDPNTGKVIEVNFRFYKDGVFATIPVSTYRKIELGLKNQVWFTPTATGKQLLFIKRGWMHEVEKPDTKTNNSPKILPILDSGLVPIE